MADSYVCSGATMKCSMGTSQAKLTVLPSRTVFLTGQPMANISDHLSMVNLAPFGRCRSLGFPATASATAAHHGTLTPMPCMHNTPFPWMGGKNDYIVKGDPALLKSSTCQCMWGGTISIVDDGQKNTGPADLSRTPKQEFKRHNSKELPDQGTSEEVSLSKNTNTISKQTNNLTQHFKVAIQEKTAEFVLSNSWKTYSKTEQSHIIDMAEKLPDNLNLYERIKKAENCLAIEKALGIMKGEPMTTEIADKQNANPKHSYKYYADPNGKEIIGGVRASKNPNYEIQYSINCATCSAAYALRLLGFDITAKGNTPNTINEWLSHAHSFDIWNNADGTKAEPNLVNDWMKKNKTTKMTGEDYKKYFDQTCKEQGVYVVTVKWKEKEIIGEDGKKKYVSPGAHATILQRDADGKLYYIEPQVYQESKSADGRRSIDDLIYNADGSLKLTPTPPENKGLMRIDNKLFNTKYISLFEK